MGTLERTLPVDMDLEAIEPTISLFQDTVEAPVKEGQVMGTMTLTYDGEVFGTLDLVATTSVDRSELLYRQEQIRQFFCQLRYEADPGRSPGRGRPRPAPPAGLP